MTARAAVTWNGRAQSIIRVHSLSAAAARRVQSRAGGTDDGFTGRTPPARAGDRGVIRSLFHVLERTRGVDRAATPASGS